MLNHVTHPSRDYAQAIAAVVAALPPERAAQVYDFARFMQAQGAASSGQSDDDDWLHDTEAQMQAEDEQWEATYDRHRAEFAQLCEQALREIAAGETQPLDDRILG